MPDKSPVFTIVIADDEAELREAICNLIDWPSIGFKLLGSAGNGLEALQLVEQVQPDLLLTDIRMPFISGTELAKQVKELQPLIQVAFLSGYDDFEYARSAIDSQVISYLLKPISTAELTTALIEIHKKMEDRFLELDSGEGGNTALALTVSSVLMSMDRDLPPEEDLYRLFLDQGLIFTRPYELVVLGTVIDGEGLLDPSIAAVTDRVIQRFYSGSSFALGRRIFTLVVSEDGFSRLQEMLDVLYYTLRRKLDTECIIGVSNRHNTLSHSNTALREAIRAIMLADSPGIYLPGSSRVEEEEEAEEAGSREKVSPDMSNLGRRMLSGDQDDLQKTLRPLLDPGVSEMTVLDALLQAQNLLSSSLGREEVERLLDHYDLLHPLSSESTRPLSSRVVEFCLAGSGLISRHKNDSMKLLTDQALRIIDENYQDDSLSLSSVSSQLHVSPNYLSANMKKYAGDTFINLLIRRRMEAALGLIGNSAMKIADVAEQCGYSDQHYFSYCFKKYYGVSPVKMRKKEETP